MADSVCLFACLSEATNPKRANYVVQKQLLHKLDDKSTLGALENLAFVSMKPLEVFCYYEAAQPPIEN